MASSPGVSGGVGPRPRPPPPPPPRAAIYHVSRDNNPLNDDADNTGLVFVGDPLLPPAQHTLAWFQQHGYVVRVEYVLDSANASLRYPGISLDIGQHVRDEGAAILAATSTPVHPHPTPPPSNINTTPSFTVPRQSSLSPPQAVGQLNIIGGHQDIIQDNIVGMIRGIDCQPSVQSPAVQATSVPSIGVVYPPFNPSSMQPPRRPPLEPDAMTADELPFPPLHYLHGGRSWHPAIPPTTLSSVPLPSVTIQSAASISCFSIKVGLGSINGFCWCSFFRGCLRPFICFVVYGRISASSDGRSSTLHSFQGHCPQSSHQGFG